MIDPKGELRWPGCRARGLGGGRRTWVRWKLDAAHEARAVGENVAERGGDQARRRQIADRKHSAADRDWDEQAVAVLPVAEVVNDDHDGARGYRQRPIPPGTPDHPRELTI